MMTAFFTNTIFAEMKNALKIIFWSQESGTVWLFNLLAGWRIFKRLWLDYFWLVLLLIVLTFVTDNWLVTSLVLMMTVVLLARPTVELPDLWYLLLRQTTVRAVLVGSFIGLADYLYTMFLRSLAQYGIALAIIAGAFRAVGIQAHYMYMSPLVVMLSFFILDAPLSVRSLLQAVKDGTRTFVVLFIPLMLVYFVTRQIIMPALTVFLSQLFALQVTLFIVSALVLPWYVGCCAQWYIRMVRKGFQL